MRFYEQFWVVFGNRLLRAIKDAIKRGMKYSHLAGDYQNTIVTHYWITVFKSCVVPSGYTDVPERAETYMYIYIYNRKINASTEGREDPDASAGNMSPASVAQNK